MLHFAWLLALLNPFSQGLFMTTDLLELSTLVKQSPYTAYPEAQVFDPTGDHKFVAPAPPAQPDQHSSAAPAHSHHHSHSHRQLFPPTAGAPMDDSDDEKSPRTPPKRCEKWLPPL